MNQNPDDYKSTIQLLKQSIIESRYQAAKLVNQHLLGLYHFIGGIISDRVADANWGDKILDRISDDLQKKCPGLKVFLLRI